MSDNLDHCSGGKIEPEFLIHKVYITIINHSAAILSFSRVTFAKETVIPTEFKLCIPVRVYSNKVST